MSRQMAGFLLAVLLAAFTGVPAIESAAQTGEADLMRPQRHFELRNPANLTATESLMIYGDIGGTMASGYAVSQDPIAAGFRKWRRLNASPYKSATHGNRYVNNFANGLAAQSYAALAAGSRLPAGAVLAKDSFTVTADGAVYAGALFVMEKRAAGASPATGDWRYAMIMPDGSYLGDSTGDNAEGVAFCHDCHRMEPETDFLFGIPEKYRMR